METIQTASGVILRGENGVAFIHYPSPGNEKYAITIKRTGEPEVTEEQDTMLGAEERVATLII